MGIKLSKWAKNNALTYRAAWGLFNSGKIPGAYKLQSGTIVVPEKEIKENKEKLVAIYARVSSSENKSNLETQINRLTDYSCARGYKIHKTVKEIGSGVNDHRPKLNALLKDSAIDVIVVEHKDRLTRFGFNYIETLMVSANRIIDVVNNTITKQDDLMSDFVRCLKQVLESEF